MPGVSFQSLLLLVGQPARAASAGRAPPAWFGPPFVPSVALGVFQPEGGHPVQTLADVRRPDARSAQIGAPDGIVHSFQVSSYSAEPVSPKSTRNLFAKDDWRMALRDEAEELRPQMPLVGRAALPASGAEGLAGAGPSPDGSCPAGEMEGVGPPPDSGEEMTLVESNKIGRSDFRD